MATTKNFYSCSSSSSSFNADADAPLLLPADATQLSLSYQYEIETISSASTIEIDEAIERVQSAMLFDIARQSGLLDCPTILVAENSTDVEKTLENEDSSWRRWLRRSYLGNYFIVPTTLLQQQPQQKQWRGLRGLSEELLMPLDRGRGRGSNSIVGLSSLPADKALVDTPCHPSIADMARSSYSGAASNDYLFSSATRQVSPGMAGLVVMGEAEEKGQEKVVMDGKHVETPINAIAPRISNSHFQKDDDNHDEEEEGAFNYISTQSKPKSASTLHQLHNPSILSHEEYFHKQESLPPESSSSQTSLVASSPLQPLARTIDTNSSNRNRSSRNKCTVVQGHMSIYTTTTSSSSYENLQGRILYAIGQSVNSNQLGIPNKNNHQDVIKAVRMHSDVPYSNKNGKGSDNVSASINSSTQENTASSINNNNFAFLSNVPMIPVMITMGILLMAVLALFISTSRPNKRRRLNYNDDRSNQKEETATIMSAKTMDIDLDAGEEVEFQSTALSQRDEKVAPKRNRSGGIGLVAGGLRNVAARRQRSSGDDVCNVDINVGSGGPGDDSHGDDGATERMPKQVAVSPNDTSNSLLYSSASLPSPSRTPTRSTKRMTTASSSPRVVSPGTPRTPKPMLRTVPQAPRAVTPDVEVELYDCLFPSTPAASCHSRNSILATPSSSSRRGQQEKMVQNRSSTGGGPQSYLDMLATTFCTNPQYEDVEVCLRPVDDCTECVENEFFAPLATSTTSPVKKVNSKEREKDRKRKKRVLLDTVPSYVFADDSGGVGSTTNRDDTIESEINLPNYVFAEEGGVVSATKKAQSMKSDAKMMKNGVLQETFESKFGDSCSDGGGRGGGRTRPKRTNRPLVTEISIEEIHDVYSNGDERRHRGARTNYHPTQPTSEASSDNGSVVPYECTTDNWFFSWW